MGCGNYSTSTPGPCPVCQKPKGAFMGSSEWRHSVSCCSDECGFKLKEKFDEFEKTELYKNLLEEIYKAKQKLTDAYIDNTGHHSRGMFVNDF